MGLAGAELPLESNPFFLRPTAHAAPAPYVCPGEHPAERLVNSGSPLVPYKNVMNPLLYKAAYTK